MKIYISHFPPMQTMASTLSTKVIESKRNGIRFNTQDVNRNRSRRVMLANKISIALNVLVKIACSREEVLGIY